MFKFRKPRYFGLTSCIFQLVTLFPVNVFCTFLLLHENFFWTFVEILRVFFLISCLPILLALASFQSHKSKGNFSINMSQNISLKILWQISSMEEKLRPPPKFFFFLAYNFWQIHCIVLKRGVGEVIHSIQSKFWVIYCKGLFTNYVGKILDFFWQPTWLTLVG